MDEQRTPILISQMPTLACNQELNQEAPSRYPTWISGTFLPTFLVLNSKASYCLQDFQVSTSFHLYLLFNPSLLFSVFNLLSYLASSFSFPSASYLKHIVSYSVHLWFSFAMPSSSTTNRWEASNGTRVDGDEFPIHYICLPILPSTTLE